MTLLDRNLPQHKATSADAAGLFPNTLTRYFARHRLVLYLLLGVGIVAARERAAGRWREAYLYRQLDERRRSASRVKQMPRVSYCRAQQWRRDHDLAGTSFLGSTRRAVRSRRAQELDRSSLDLASRTR